MKTVGIIGGTGPESTIAYYRQIIAGYRARKADGSYPSLIINSIDLKKLLDLAAASRLQELTLYLLDEVRKLAAAGADFGILAAVTPHLVFDMLAAKSPIPLISIVEVTRDAAAALGLKRLGIFGTRFTMEAAFFPEVLQKSGIAVALPTHEERNFIHEKYLSELVNGILLPETRAGLLKIVSHMKTADHIDGLILGGTELPLILTEASYEGIPFLDTTKLQVERVVEQLLS
jgi:aspartate racemase